MAYRCLRCPLTFTRGCAFEAHKSVHATLPPALAATPRVRFPNSEPYDAEDYPSSALAFDDDDGVGPSGGGGGEPPAHAQQAPAPQLSIEDELKLRLCELKTNGASGSGLSEADMNNILRIVELAGRANSEELFANCDELTRHLLELVAQHPELMWYVAEVRAPSFLGAPPAKFVYRRLEDMLTSMVSTLEIKWGFWDYETTQGGERIYAHPCGAELFEAVCNLLEGTGLWALALQLWSDKANLTKRGNKTYYPLSCVVLPVLFDQFREQWPDSAIAFLPVIERTDMPATMTDRDFQLYKAEIEAACLERVLLPVLSAGHVVRCVDNTGAVRDVVAVLHSWVADFMEQLTLAGLIGQTGCALCEVAGGALLPDPDGDEEPATPRTASSMAAALAAMRAAWDASRTTEFDRLRGQCRLQGTSSILLTLFQRGLVGHVAASNGNLHSLVPASVMPFDTLHVFEEGWTKRLINAFAKNLDAKYGKTIGRWLTDTLAMRWAAALDMAFIEETKWPNPYKVFRGKGKKQQEGCGGLQACEMRAVCQLLPLLLPGILGDKTEDSWRACAPDDDYLTDVFCAYVTYYMELKRYNRPPGHTARTLELLEHLGARFLRVLRRHFLDDQISGFAFPKAHQGFSEHVPATIKLLGAPQWLSTEWGENSVKSGHAAYEATNKNTGTSEQQMAVHLAKRAAARRAMAEAGLSAAPAGLGTRRTARRLAESTGVNTLVVENVCRVALEDFSADPLPPTLVDRPGMAAFASELQRFLTTAQRPIDVPWVHIVNSAALNAKMAHHPDAYAGTSLHTVYAAPSFRRQRRMSFVALEGEGDEGAEEWIAQLLLLFRLPDGTPLAYVQFLVVDPERAEAGPLLGTPGAAPLVWERVGPRRLYSYAVTHLDKLIRREFVMPDLSGVYAPRRFRQRREAARATRKARRWAESSEEDGTSSGGNSNSSDSSSEEDEADEAQSVPEDGPAKRWPRWIRNPFVWGW